MFSTPLEHPYNMKGKYEMSLMNMSYSGCINTFDNDELSVSKPLPQQKLTDAKFPLRFNIDKDFTIKDFIEDINKKLKTIMEWKYEKISNDSFTIHWKMANPQFCLLLSKQLSHVLKCNRHVITSRDLINLSNKVSLKARLGNNAFYLVIPQIDTGNKISIKEVNEVLTLDQLINRFNERVKLAHIDVSRRLKATDIMYDHQVLLLSPKLQFALMYLNGAITVNDMQNAMPFNYTSEIKSEFFVTVLNFESVQTWSEYHKLVTKIILPPHSFSHTKDVISYLEEHVNDKDLSFTIDKDFLTLHIHNKDTKVTFSDTLRDIFAFDKNEYSGDGKYRASDVFSLTRRIQYLYVYSNISDYVRVGNTEAPLLAIIPFEANNVCGSFIEKSFNTPMYVKVAKDFISQIDIYIYDGSGKRVPFSNQVVTTIRLHYRPI